MTGAPDDTFAYDVNNRLVTYNGNTVSYDLDGNMLNDGVCSYTYDSANRLKSFGGHTYTYTSEDIRIRNLCADEDTTYTYNTNCKLSQLLTKTTNGVITKYVYGRGLIGEEVSGSFKTYHFDCRGSTVAITDANGNITDTFAYDTYGNLVSRTGTSNVIFLYNGRDGVITDDNGLYYMRARYYSPEMRRFVNADIIPGEISNAVTLNRYAYANGNPVSNVDPFGLWSWSSVLKKVAIGAAAIVVGAAVVAATAATGGAAAAFVGAAVAGVKAAAVSGAIGAAVGAGTSAISHRVSTGTWKGAEKAALDGAVEGFADGFMSGGISYGVGMSTASLLKHSNGVQIGKTAKPQYGKVNAMYGNPNKGGATFVSFQNSAGKRFFGLEADLIDSVHMHIPALTSAHIPFSYVTGTISGIKTGVDYLKHDNFEEEKQSRK